MDEFTNLLLEFKNNIDANIDFFQKNVIRNPTLAYYKINELSKFVGSRHGLVFEIHFPDPTKIRDIRNYGSENMSFIFDKFRKTFPIGRDLIKFKAVEIFSESVQVNDAYMYEEKEGVRIILSNQSNEQSRIEVLPGSFHLWVKIDKSIEKFCNWLLSSVYMDRAKKINDR
jgi:hypothetical protein